MADDNNKMERTMQFILEQQAQNTVAIGQLTEKVDKLSDKVDRTADSAAALLNPSLELKNKGRHPLTGR